MNPGLVVSGADKPAVDLMTRGWLVNFVPFFSAGPNFDRCGLPPRYRRYHGRMDVDVKVLEVAFIALLVTTVVVITWFAGYVVSKLFKGQK